MMKSAGKHTTQMEHDFISFHGIADWYTDGINGPEDRIFTGAC